MPGSLADDSIRIRGFSTGADASRSQGLMAQVWVRRW
jgi:hypothetical protein